MNMSTKQLNRVVKKETGLTLCTMINQIKIEYIKQMLASTDYSLADVAERIGCSNEYNLIRFFKREEGMSPGRYRNSLKQ